MLFSGIPFLYYFLPLLILIYLAAPKNLKNSVLFIFSLLFYAWGEKKLVLLFILAILINWFAGLLIDKYNSQKKLILWITVLIDLGMLGYFKYVDFFIENLNALGLNIPLLHIALPIGISFYTFQMLSYVIDVYRKDVEAQRSLITFGTYVALFPQLIAGPIVRYSDIEKQLNYREHSTEKTASGISRFIVGLSKKVLIANVCGEIATAFRTSQISVLGYWLYAISYMLQIYYDFSGYSDMAIGLGKIFGFDFLENFNYPYISKSVTEFWRRWHMSLGSWFRDYVYIPLGGNRCSRSRQLFNIFVVWFLTGLWHGAAWNFILWGLLYAVLLVLEKNFYKSFLDEHPFIAHVYVLFVVMIGFVLFNASSLQQCVSDVAGLFAFGKYPLVTMDSLYALRSNWLVIVFGIAGSTPLIRNAFIKVKEHLPGLTRFMEPIALMILLLIVTAYLVDGTFNPFLYFRF